MACVSPIWKMPSGGFREVPVPCGRCPPCMKRRIDSWVFRLQQHEKVCTHSHFVTLTYDNEHVPISPNGFMTLDKTEFPRFMKRLRKLCPGIKLSYYAVGEYGTEGSRPHYHALIFNVPNPVLYEKAWMLDDKLLGNVVVGTVTGDSIAYCTAYVGNSVFKPWHNRDDRLPEFSLMSKGMGLNYITDATRKYHNNDVSRNYLTKSGGSVIALPRYYRQRIYDKEQQEEQRVLADEQSKILDEKALQYYNQKYGDRSDYSFDQFKRDGVRARFTRFLKQKKHRKGW